MEGTLELDLEARAEAVRDRAVEAVKAGRNVDRLRRSKSGPPCLFDLGYGCRAGEAGPGSARRA